MSNQIVLYRECKIVPWKNFSVDDLSDYLETLSNTKTYSSTQFFKHALELTYKLDLSQRELDFNPISMHNYNYLMAQNEGGVILGGIKVYYFVVGKKWISSSCIEFSLKMDTINTFKDLSISPKTTILRQHKNRWKSGTSPETKFPVVDLYSEGIETPLYKYEESTLYAVYGNYMDETTWYLIYRSQQAGDSASIDTFLCADERLEFAISSPGYTGWRSIRSDFRTSYTGIIYGSDSYQGRNNVGARITFTDKDDEEHSITFASGTCVMYDYFEVRVGYSDTSGFHLTTSYRFKQGKKNQRIYLQNISVVRAMKRTQTQAYYYSNFTPSYISDIGSVLAVDYSGITITDTIGSITDIDRADPLLLKIIKLPYCPISLDLSEETFNYVPQDWTIENQIANYPALLRYVGGQTISCLSQTLLLDNEDPNFEGPLNIYRQTAISSFGKLVFRNKDYEPKLLHSDFFQQKFVYDNFSFNFIGEYLKEIDGPYSFEATMCVSTAMSSRFMFSFEQYKDLLKIDTQDYSAVMQITRNNEVPLYNSAYLNYIRSGYNYDIKTKNRQLAFSIASGVVQTTGAVMSAVGGGPFGVAGAVGLGVSAYSKFSSALQSTIQSEQSIAQKMKTAELQGISILGADDVDILSYYTEGAKAKFVRYKVSEKMENVLFDLFYYYGYIANIQGIPNTTSRKVFNFVQADIIFDVVPNLPKEVVDDVVALYKEGITFIHHYTLKNNLGVDVRGWDFEQQYENWETTTS